MSDESTMELPLDPTARARSRDISGIPVTLSDGQSWLLARPGLSPVLTEARDRIFDDAAYRRCVSVADVIETAWLMLVANYDLDEAEIVGLLTDAGDKALSDAVMIALFGYPNPHRTYTEWVLSAFRANAVDPEKIPPELIPDVMAQLVLTGRAAPEDQFITSAIMAKKRQRFFGGPGT